MTRPWALPAGWALPSPQPGGKEPLFAPRTPRAPEQELFCTTHTPQVPKFPAHHQHPASLMDQCSQLDPRGLPQPSWEVRLYTHPQPPRQDRHTLTHTIHTPAAMFRGWMVMQLKRPEIAQAGDRDTGAGVGRGRPPRETAQDGARSPSDSAPGSPHSTQTPALGELAPVRPAHGSTDHEDSSGG